MIFVKLYRRPIGWAMLLLVVWVFCGTADADAAELRFRHRRSIYTGQDRNPLNLPEGVAGVSISEMIVADTGNRRLLRYESENEYEYRLSSAVDVSSALYPTKIQVRTDGEMVVLDRDQMQVVRIGPDGALRGPIAFAGSPGEPVVSFALDGLDNCYLMGLKTGRIVMIEPEGGVGREILPPEGPARLVDIAVDRNGRVLAVDGVAGVVYAAGTDETALAPITGSLKQYARFPSRIAVDERGRIYLTDRNGCRIIVLGQDGSYLTSAATRGVKDSLFQYPAQVSVSGNTVFVADTRNHRIQVFTLSE